MVDLVPLVLKAGHGGNGRISFLRTRHQPKGGPDGGDGGHGASIVLKSNRNMQTLRDFSGKLEIVAPAGRMGGKQNSTGADASDIELSVPVGTLVWKVTNRFIKRTPKQMYERTMEGDTRTYDRPRANQQEEQADGAVVHTIGANGKVVRGVINETIPMTKTIIWGNLPYEVELAGEVTDDGQLLPLVRGGSGGRGNWIFRSSTNTTPMHAETGQGGEEGLFFFELQLLADLGLVGFPNAGKSTLLSVLTSAHPQIAAYPFTTIEPNLGMLIFDNPNPAERASYVIADIPGIIEGASDGKGLGVAFLRHIARCRVLLMLLAIPDAAADRDVDDVYKEVETTYEQLLHELATYQEQVGGTGVVDFTTKEQVVVLNKIDTLPPEAVAALQKKLEKKIGKKITLISAHTHQGIEELKTTLRSSLVR